jgi:hypothetical protein
MPGPAPLFPAGAVDPREYALYQSRPQNHQDGVFPREYLTHDERIIYECKPNFLGYLFPHILLTVIMVLLFVILPQAFGDWVAAGFFAFLWGLAFVVRLLGYFFTVYAVTDKRVLRKSAVLGRNIVDIRFERVSSVYLHQTLFMRLVGCGNLYILPMGVAFGGQMSRSVAWIGMSNPVQTRAYLEEVSNLYHQKAKELEYRQMAAAMSQAFSQGAMPFAPPAGMPPPGYGGAPQGSPPASPGAPGYFMGAPTASPPSATPSPAAAPPPPPPPASVTCTRCGRPTTFVPQYNRNYCYACAQYV